jgi:hypothetical protein
MEDDNRCKQSNKRDYDNQIWINKRLKASCTFHQTPSARDGEITKKARWEVEKLEP